MRTRFSLVAAAIALLLRADGSRPVAERPTHPAGSSVSRVTGFSGRPFGVHVTRSGGVIVTAQDVDRIMHLDSSMTPTAYLGVGSDPGDVVANWRGTTAYVSGFHDGTIAVVDLVADSVVSLMKLPSRNAYRLALSPNEKRLFVTTTEGILYALGPDERRVHSTKRLEGSLQGIALDHPGRNVFVSSSAGDIWRLDRVSLRTIGTTHLHCRAQDVVLDRDDVELYVACEEGSVVILDPRTLEIVANLAVPTGSAFGLAVTPDNAQLYVTSPASGDISIFDRASRENVSNLPVKGVPRRVAFNARGDKAFVTNEWNWLNVIN